VKLVEKGKRHSPHLKNIKLNIFIFYFSFAQEQHLVMHSRFHGSLDPFVCQDCGASFPRKFQLVNHGKLHGRVPHECSVCGQEFLQKRTLVAHMRQHTDAPHACLNCGEGFRTKSELTAHQRIVHNIQPPVRVKNASATTTSNNQSIQENQVDQHSQEMEEEQHFMKQEHQQYETIHTIQEQPQQTQSYQTITMVPSGSPSMEHKTIRIQQHTQQNIHSQNQHVCQQCGSCFNNREALQLHLRLHTGDKSLMTDLQLLTQAIPGHIFQSQGNTYIEIDGGKCKHSHFLNFSYQHVCNEKKSL
jgi:KRAB domain-containing zinc finger protein